MRKTQELRQIRGAGQTIFGQWIVVGSVIGMRPFAGAFGNRLEHDLVSSNEPTARLLIVARLKPPWAPIGKKHKLTERRGNCRPLPIP